MLSELWPIIDEALDKVIDSDICDKVAKITANMQFALYEQGFTRPESVQLVVAMLRTSITK